MVCQLYKKTKTSLQQDANCSSYGMKDLESLDSSNGAVIATQHGTMSIRLHSRMRVDMTIDRAIRVTNLKVSFSV